MVINTTVGSWVVDNWIFENLRIWRNFVVFAPYTPQDVPASTYMLRNGVSGWFLIIWITGSSLSSL